MTWEVSRLVAVSTNRGAAYDLVLLAHVLAAVAAFGTVIVAGLYANVLLRRTSVSDAVTRYYRPGVNWAGRVLFAVPLLGVALIAMSRGGWSYSDRWVMGGLALWAVVAVVGEVVLWPAERRLQGLVTSGHFDRSLHRALCLKAVGSAAGMCVLLIVTTVVMVAKP